MCKIDTSSYKLCNHTGPTQVYNPCPDYVDNGFVKTCDNLEKREYRHTVIKGWCRHFARKQPDYESEEDESELVEDLISDMEDEDEGEDVEYVEYFVLHGSFAAVDAEEEDLGSGDNTKW